MIPDGGSLVTAPTDRFTVLLTLLAASLLATGLGTPIGGSIVAVLNASILIVAFRSAGLVTSRLRLAELILVALLGVASSVVFDLERSTGAIGWMVQAVILSAIAVVVTKRVLVHERVGIQTIAGALCLYVLIGLVFGVLYGAFEAITDDAILHTSGEGRADPVYYSFVTLTTVGFGDVTSSLDLVRRVTIVQAMIGQIFLATMVARLVSMFGAVRPGAAAPGVDG